MVHENFKELIPGRALSALDRADDRLLSEHLASCPECQQELESWTSVAAALALGAKADEPSPQVRERILREIQSEGKSGNPPTESGKVIPFTAPTRRGPRIFRSLALIAAALAFLASIVSVFVLLKREQQARSQVASLSSQLNSLQQQLSSNSEFLSFFTAPGKTFEELSPTNAAPGAHAILAYDKAGHTLLAANGLPATPSGKEYQLWYIAGSKTVPRGTFTADQNGKAFVRDQLPPDFQAGAVFAITLEPAGGSRVPTSDVLLHSGS